MNDKLPPPPHLVLVPSSDPPSEPDYRRVDPRAVNAWRLTGLVAAGIGSFVSLCALGIVALSGTLEGALGIALGAAWLVGSLAFLGIASGFPRLRFEHLSYRADERGFSIRSGVFWQSETFVPRSRVQHTDVARGPIDRAFGIAKLVVHTAGTENASIVLGGLAEDDARLLRDRLIEHSGDGDAV